ncbi:MAG: hypothetical protein QXU74_02050 [Candidatus Aenigmatarchaeota archaeon]
MSLGNLTKDLFKDYTLEDFEKESPEKKTEILTTSINHPTRALTFLSLDPTKVYSKRSEVMEQFLSYLGIPLKEFKENKSYYADFISPHPINYWAYIDDRIKKQGVLSRINLLTRRAITPTKVGYNMTSFGKSMKGFVAYSMKSFAELGINPWDLLGSTDIHSGKRAPSTTLKVLKSIKNGKKTLKEVSDDTRANPIHLEIHLKRLESLGLVKYKSISTVKGEKKIYKINRKKVEKVEIELKEDYSGFKERLNRKFTYFTNWGYFSKAVEYLKNKDEVTSKDLLDYLDIRDMNSSYLFALLKKLGLIKPKEFPRKSLSQIEISNLFFQVYEKIVEPIFKIVENVNELKNYEEFEIKNEEIRRLLWTYSGNREKRGKRKKEIYLFVKKNPGCYIDWISKELGYKKSTIKWILFLLKKDSKVHSDNRGRWYAANEKIV